MLALAIVLYPAPDPREAGTLARIVLAATDALEIPCHLASVGQDLYGRTCGHLTLIRRGEGQESGMATARNLVDRLPELLGGDLQGCLSGVRVTWNETHAGVGILGLTERTYELSVTY